MRGAGVGTAVDTVTGPDTLEHVHRAFARCWAQHPEIRAEVRTHMELAASEIAANIVEHSAAGRPVRLRMDLDVSAGKIRTTFRDDGEPVRIDLGAVRMPPSPAERGRGLAIAVGIVDALCYRRGDGINTWTLVRNLHR